MIPPRMNQSLIEDHHLNNNKYIGGSSDKNNSSFDHNPHTNFLFEETRAGLLSEER